MNIGKLDNEALKRLVLGKVGTPRPEVLVGPGIGEDCAVLDFGEYECVLSTDPITASASRIGTLAVHISCNDIASNGVEPLAIMLTVLLPSGTTEEEISEIARQADEAAKSLGIQIIGGHTEVTDVVIQPLVSATAIGRALKSAGGSSGMNRPLLSFEAPLPGDLLVVTKSLGLEGTAISAEQKERELRSFLSEDELAHAKAMLDRISVVREGVIAGNLGVRTMHDVTEGGVLGAVWEVCARYGIGAEIIAASLPFDPVTLALCAVLDLDPMRLISSGSMLMMVPKEKWTPLLKEFSEAGIEASIIGSVKTQEDGVILVMKNGDQEVIETPGPDEIYKI